jgi:O-acetyl-ADP-ribose deacetylase (regulator of RNase III)
MAVNITLIDLNIRIVEAWRNICGDLENVNIQYGSIFDLACDAIVSPANSFGFMDGGLDHRISKFLGWGVQERLQQMIRTKHYGELLVGTAEIVETYHPNIPYVISAPTMRMPMILHETVNPYLATRAVLLLAKHGVFENGQAIKDVVRTIAFPGMGTGVGCVTPEVCAKQMRAAIDDVLLGKYKFPTSWFDVQQRHQLLYGEKTRDLQFE